VCVDINMECEDSAVDKFNFWVRQKFRVRSEENQDLYYRILCIGANSHKTESNSARWPPTGQKRVLLLIGLETCTLQRTLSLSLPFFLSHTHTHTIEGRDPFGSRKNRCWYTKNNYIINMFCIFCFHRANWHSSATLTEVYPYFFLSCKANARV
jgi:hypothetical protein